MDKIERYKIAFLLTLAAASLTFILMGCAVVNVDKSVQNYAFDHSELISEYQATSDTDIETILQDLLDLEVPLIP